MDPRNKPTVHGGVDLNDIDPNWIKNCTSAKKMRSAVKLLTEDGYYPDLLKLAEEKLCELDPEYKRRKELPAVTVKDREAAAKSIEEFLEEIEKPKQRTEEEIKLEQAKEERLRGNECIAAHDYKVAIRYYERSIKLDPNEAATYSNRSLAYLKLNDYKNAFDDAETAIRLMPGYLKAYHRRAEAALGLGEYERGYIDVRAILSIEVENASVKETMMKILKKAHAAKIELDLEKVKSAAAEIVKKIQEAKIAAPVKPKPKEVAEEKKKEEKRTDGFVKVAITEEEVDSSESEEENIKKEVVKDSIWSEEEVKVIPAKVETPAVSTKELEKLLTGYNKLREEGNKLNRSGQYSEAIEKYIKAINELKEIKQLREDERVKYEAIANSNIAVCYKQMQESNKVIEYTTKVIESKVNDNAILIKTLVLRAFAYESIDELTRAKDDWTKVKQLQWNNTDASLGLERINDAFKRDKGQKIGEVLRSIKPQLESHKENGNAKYKEGKHKEAVEDFTKGINLFIEKCNTDNYNYTPKDLLQIIGQLYTNRALCYHMLGQHEKVVEDTSFVITKVDSKSAKAYYRRGVALFNIGDNEKALGDLQQASGIDPNNALIKGELKKVLDLVIEERKKKSKTETKKETKKIIEEISSTTKPTVTQTKEEVKKKKITEEQISKAAALAAQALGKDYLSKPKTAYAFENIWRSHKNDNEKLYQLLSESVDPDYLATLFKDSEIPTEVYLSLIKILNFSFKEYV